MNYEVGDILKIQFPESWDSGWALCMITEINDNFFTFDDIWTSLGEIDYDWELEFSELNLYKIKKVGHIVTGNEWLQKNYPECLL